MIKPTDPPSRAANQKSVLIMPHEGYIPSTFYTSVEIEDLSKTDVEEHCIAKGKTANKLFADVQGYVDSQNEHYWWERSSDNLTP